MSDRPDDQMAISDTRIDCVDCGTTFTFSLGEQAWFKDKGFSTPKRCPDCRAERKQAREAEKIQEDIQRKVEGGEE